MDGSTIPPCGKGSRRRTAISTMISSSDRCITDLPNHIAVDILARLPFKSVFACRLVCKLWYNLTKNDPDFAKVHLSKSSSQLMIRSVKYSAVSFVDFEGDTTRGFGVRVPIGPRFDLPIHGKKYDRRDCAVSSCHGFLLLTAFRFKPLMVVCNPLTGEYIEIPKPALVDFYPIEDFLFGFCPCTNQFKVLHFMGREYPGGNIILWAEIHVVGTNLWKPVGNVPFYRMFLSTPCFLHKAMHWICDDHQISNFVVYFDFECEGFGEIPTPPCLREHPKMLGVLSDCLCLTNVLRKSLYEIWLMKDYGVRQSWTKAFAIDTLTIGVRPRGLYQPVKCMKNGELVMISDDDIFFCFNPQKKSARFLKFSAYKRFNLAVHTPSFISLKDILADNNVEVLNLPRPAEPESTCFEDLKIVEFRSFIDGKKRVTRPVFHNYY